MLELRADIKGLLPDYMIMYFVFSAITGAPFPYASKNLVSLVFKMC